MAEITEMFLTLFKRQEVWDHGASRVGVWWGLSPWVAVSHHLTVCSHDLSSVPAYAVSEREREWERSKETALWCLFLIRTLTLILPYQGFTFITSFNLNYFLRGPSPNAVIWGLWIWVLGGHIQSITVSQWTINLWNNTEYHICR